MSESAGSSPPRCKRPPETPAGPPVPAGRQAASPLQPRYAFEDSPHNWLRITTIRVLVQAIVFTLSLSFVLLTTFAHLDRLPGLRRWVSKILEVDPLVSLATAATTHTVYRALLWSLVILVPTLLLGRFFCNWICPFGTLHQFVGWLFRRAKPGEAFEANRYRKSQRVKYYLLAGLLAAAALGSLQIGLLDPIALWHRSLTEAVLPAARMATRGLGDQSRLYQGAWLVGLLVFGLLFANLTRPRFFCRVLCPLGALLGWLSRVVWWRIERDPVACNGCNRCLLSCEGACDPHAALRTSECFVCFNCIEECPEGALSFRWLPPKQHEVAGVDVPRRKVIFAAVGGALFFPFVRTSGRTTRDFSSAVIRPPGAREESEFLKRCIKCGQCIRVCPTNVLQPAWFQAGLEGLWTPILNFRMGHCQFHCTACGQVCPTGAIQPLSIERKLGLGAFAEQGPIRLGTAHFDTGRCLPHGRNIPCVVCEEVCPTSPKAIYTVRERRTVRNGKRRVIDATEDTVRVSDPPLGPTGDTRPRRRSTGEWKSDGTKTFYLLVRHGDGTTETHRIRNHDRDTVTIEGRFARRPEPGEAVLVQIELALPRVEPGLCIGCGICERQCPVVGDRRAVYVTADGETRSQAAPQRDRNRSVQWT